LTCISGFSSPISSEQDALDQIVRDRRAIHRHEGAAGAVGGALDGARHHLLAYAALALDQDRDVGAGAALGQIDHLAHAGALADQVVEAHLPGDLSREA
jgi:hypothetical protein